MRTVNLSLLAGLVALVLLVACKSPPSELEPAQNNPTTTTSQTNAPNASVKGGNGDTPAPAKKGGGGGDPMDGSFSLAAATKDLKGAGPIVAKIET